MFSHGGEAFADGEAALGVGVPFGGTSAPEFHFLGRRLVLLGVWNILSEQEREVAIHAEGIGRMEQLGS